MNADASVLAHAQSAAIDIVTTVRANLNRGDELFSSLTALLGYGSNDAVLRSWCRSIQKRLESPGGIE